MRKLPAALVTLVLIAFLGACATPSPSPQPPAFQDPVTPAKTSAERERYLKMARRYTRLATKAPPPQRQDYQLRAANILALAGFTHHARQILGAIHPDSLNPSQRIRIQLLEAYIAVLEHKPAEALQYLAPPLPASASRARKADYHRLRATAFAMEGKHLHSARERVALEPYLDTRAAIEKNHRAIWQSLSQVDEETLTRVKVSPPPDELGGWIELARISKLFYRNGLALRQKLSQWKRNYPAHPANRAILTTLSEQSEHSLALQPQNIALLLPLSGNLKPAGEAIQNGFLSAYYSETAENPSVQRIRIYDAASGEDIHALYRRAQEEGADFIVGPLDKGKLAQLANAGHLAIPTLALNYLDSRDETGEGDFFQLGLSPEDEARQVARRIWADGHNRVGILYPDDAWGRRVAAAFTAEWEKNGPTVIARQPYKVRGPDFSAPVARLLEKARSTLPPPGDEPRPAREEEDEEEMKVTPGIDALFMPGYPRQLRQLRPQLRFHDAGELPVYATSLAYTGKPNPAMDGDLNGLVFCDMPWILDTKGGDRKLRRSIKHHFDIAPDSQLNRLYALGVDAYRIIPMLASLQSRPYEYHEGETGTLMMDEQGRIHRYLVWAVFERGVPRLLQTNHLSSNP